MFHVMRELTMLYDVDIDCCLQDLVQAVPDLAARVSKELLHSYQAFARSLIAEPDLAARGALALGAARQLEKYGLEGLNYAASNFHTPRSVSNSVVRVVELRCCVVTVKCSHVVLCLDGVVCYVLCIAAWGTATLRAKVCLLIATCSIESQPCVCTGFIIWQNAVAFLS